MRIKTAAIAVYDSKAMPGNANTYGTTRASGVPKFPNEERWSACDSSSEQIYTTNA